MNVYMDVPHYSTGEEDFKATKNHELIIMGVIGVLSLALLSQKVAIANTKMKMHNIWHAFCDDLHAFNLHLSRGDLIKAICHRSAGGTSISRSSSSSEYHEEEEKEEEEEEEEEDEEDESMKRIGEEVSSDMHKSKGFVLPEKKTKKALEAQEEPEGFSAL